MRILAFNCGSSSIKCALLASSPAPCAPSSCASRTSVRHEAQLVIGDTRRALAAHLPASRPRSTPCSPSLRESLDGARRDRRRRPSRRARRRALHRAHRSSTTNVLASARCTLDRLAPLHNPPAICRRFASRANCLSGVPHVAVFDTAFHATLPRRAREYALPEDIRIALAAFAAYGFHGISHGDVARRRCAAHAEESPQELARDFLSSRQRRQPRRHRIRAQRRDQHGHDAARRAGDGNARGRSRSRRVLLELARELAARMRSTSCSTSVPASSGLAGTGGLRDIERRAAEGDEQLPARHRPVHPSHPQVSRRLCRRDGRRRRDRVHRWRRRTQRPGSSSRAAAPRISRRPSR